MCQTKSLYSWHEHAPGTWHRDIDEVETFWAKALRIFDSQGRKPFVITGHVTLRVDGTTTSSSQNVNQALREAWCRIRQDHPSIASRVNYDFRTEKFTRIYHTVRNNFDREAWLNDTFFEISNGQSGADFANSDPVAPELPTIFVITPPSYDDNVHRDIVFRAPHDTIDGVGTLLLLGNILKHASEALEQGSSYSRPEFNGTEVNNLSPPLRIAAMVPESLSSAQKAKVDTMFSEHVFFGQSHEPKHYLSLPFKQGAQVPGRHQRTEIILDQTKSSQIMTACKNMGVTVTHAFHAAIPFVMRDLVDCTQHQRELYYRCDLLRNLRPICADPFGTSKHPVTAYHAGSMSGFETKMSMPKGEGQQSQKIEFQQIVQEISAFYRRVASDSDHADLAPHVWAGWLQTLPKLEIHPTPGPPPSPSPGVSISSLGRVDDMLPPEIGPFSVSNPWVTGEEMGNGYGLFLTSHRGEINLAAAYNEAWQTDTAAREFLQACIRLLRISLEINE